MAYKCSKSYVVANGDECNFSLKGITKKNVLTVWETYDNVLKKQKAGSAMSRGTHARDNTMFTYTQ